MPIGDYPILEVIVRQLGAHGFRSITLAVNHHANLIEAFFGDGSRWGVSIDYSVESKPLSTIAPLKLIPDLPDHFLLMNGDVLTDLNLSSLWEKHLGERRLFTIAAACRTEVTEYGVLHVDASSRLAGFEEKPTTQHLVSMGVYMVSRSTLDGVPHDVKYGFDDLMHHLLAEGIPVHVERHAGYWMDIGRPDDYRQAIDDFDAGRQRFLLE
jgi:NDP-sugar pyrophosphorylase family protein